MEDNPLQRDHCVSVVLPGGLEKTATVHGSKPVLDLLVTLCATYHLNPSDHTVEILSASKNISFKPNSPIGSLDADQILLKPKGIMEEKIRRPYMPEATVRVMINYRACHKAVVRVNPTVALELLMPLICSKCEFAVETAVLLRHAQSHQPLDLTKSFNDHGLREVFAKDTAAVTLAEVISPPPPEVCVEEPNPPKKEKQEEKRKEKQTENKGFFTLFRRGKKKHAMNASVSAPASPGLNGRVISLNSLVARSPNTLPADKPKKRRAPQPPMGASHSVPDNLSTHHLKGSQSSADSTLRRTKRRAPPPPCGNSRLEDTEVKGTVSPLYTLPEHRETKEESDSPTLSSSTSSPSSSSPPQPSSSSSSPPQPPRPSSSSSSSMVHPQESSSPCPPTSPSLGKELHDGGRLALARILTSSLSDASTSAKFPTGTHDDGSSPPPPATRPRGGSFCSELGSKLGLRRPLWADSEWQDPRERKQGLTTFKVVPAALKQRLYDVVLTLEPLDHASEEEDDRRTQEDPGTSPESPETERPLPDSELSDVPSFLPPPLTRLEEESRRISPVLVVEEEEPGGTSQVLVVEEEEPGGTSQVLGVEEEEAGGTSQVPEVEEEELGGTSQVPDVEEEEAGETSQVLGVEEEEAGGTSQVLVVEEEEVGGTSQVLGVEEEEAGGTSQVLVVEEEEPGGTSQVLVVEEEERGGTSQVPVVEEEEPGGTSQVLVVEEEEPGGTSQVPVVEEEEVGGTSQVLVVEEEEPGGTSQVPVVEEEEVGGTSQVLVVEEEEPGGTSQVPVFEEEEPGGTSQVLVVEEEELGGTSQVPVVEEEEPGGTSQVPVVEEEEPGGTSQVPVVEEEEPGGTSQVLGVEEEERGGTSQVPEVEEGLEKADGDDLVSATVKSEPPPASLLDRSHRDITEDAGADPERESASIQSPGKEPPETDQMGSEIDDDAAKVDDIGSKVVEGANVDEDYFPPPPPPVFYDDDDEEESAIPSCNGQRNGFSGGHLLQLTSPKPYRSSPTAHRPMNRVATVPSRFAQAVARAVQYRSQSKGQGSRVNRGPPCSTPSSSTGSCTDTVPEWRPHTSVNGGSCLG